MRVWADGDSLPSELRRVIERRAAREAEKADESGGIPVFTLVYVASRRIAVSPPAELILVEAGADAADARILEAAAPEDIAVTRDLPLAERLAEKGLLVLNDRGDIFTIDMVRERRSLRDRALELRALGVAPESPRAKSYGKRELKAFSDAFDRVLARAVGKRGT